MLRHEESVKLMEEALKDRPVLMEPDAAGSAVLELSYRNLHHALVGLLRTGDFPGISQLFLGLRSAYDRLYLSAMKDPLGLATSWHMLAAFVQNRYRKAEIYSKQLEGGPWQLLDGWKTSKICWRYSLLLDSSEQLVKFSDSVRSDGFHVSNLYWPVNSLFRPSDACPNADAFARRIVNLWVDESVDATWVRRCTDSMWKRSNQLLK